MKFYKGSLFIKYNIVNIFIINFIKTNILFKIIKIIFELNNQ